VYLKDSISYLVHHLSVETASSKNSYVSLLDNFDRSVKCFIGNSFMVKVLESVHRCNFISVLFHCFYGITIF